MAAVRSSLAGGGLPSRAFYRVVRGLVVALCRMWLGLTVHGSERVPSSGAFIVAPTHRSAMDIPIAAAASTRRLRFMGKDSLWRRRPIGAVLSALGGFPVTRGSADLEALKRCVAVLTSGEPLVLFPEGTRQAGPTVHPLFDGAAFVAFKAGVPIVPAAIAGSEVAMAKGRRSIGRGRCALVIGEPIHLPAVSGRRASREDLAALTEVLRDRMQQLLDEANAIVGAQRPR
ncbi:MAG: 1-acyl-sn-glycerol-3-phosphate acyltransferase [Acidobacteria bacterium]|nr:1-acyl-sn-glycerol-3-phosphate acyltransferase [Acidobacteriota bacterium]